MNFFQKQPIEENGYILFTLHNKHYTSVKQISPRILLCKPDIQNVEEVIIRGSKILYSKLNLHNERYINLHSNLIIRIPTFLSYEFIEQAFFNLFIYDKKCLHRNLTPMIATPGEQISITINMYSTYTLREDNFFIGIHIPFPYSYEIVLLD